MSTPTPSDKPNSVAAGDFPSDPLLFSGSFISSDTAAGDNTANRRPIQGGTRAIGSGQSVRIGMSNGTDQVHQSEPKSRKRAAADDKWLPPGWKTEEKIRESGATAGTIDKYYIEPVTNRKFRSRSEVLSYLETGTIRRGAKKAENTNSHSSFDGQGSNKVSRKPRAAQPLPLKFDFESPPEKVSWSRTKEGEEEAWITLNGEEDKVQDSVIRDWSNAFMVISSGNPSKLSF